MVPGGAREGAGLAAPAAAGGASGAKGTARAAGAACAAIAWCLDTQCKQSRAWPGDRIRGITHHETMGGAALLAPLCGGAAGAAPGLQPVSWPA